MKFKNFFCLFIVLAVIAILPAKAVKWDNFGLDAGIYVDTDSVTDFGSSMSFTYKFTNEYVLKEISSMAKGHPELSECYMRATVNCPSGTKQSSELICYDKSDNIIIDESNLTYKNNTEQDPKMCKNLKKIKRYRRYNLI